MKKLRIIVAMSGGVDSSVAAALLKQQGHEVIGLFMENWSERNGQKACSAEQDFSDMAAVCEQIGIEYHHVNFAKEYWQEVFCQFIDDHKQGLTPNPDILCNREIKFKTFLHHALKLGADAMATGHYCQIDHVLSYPRLSKGRDLNKDQSYFLQAIGQEALSKSIFPIGHLKKSQVRKIAQDFNLLVAPKKDSTGICFIGKRNFKGFLADYIHAQKGPIKTLSGQQVGEHSGLSFYTFGQRKGLGLGGAGMPWFVVDKDFGTNTLTVERGQHHLALYTDRLWACELKWINPSSNKRFERGKAYPLKAKIRYRQRDQECFLSISENDEIEVSFPLAQRAVAVGQYIALYENDICLGGAKIIKRQKSFYHRGLSLPPRALP